MDDPVAMFVAITGGTEEEAVQFLTMCDFDTESAIAVYEASKPVRGVSAGSSPSAVHLSPTAEPVPSNYMDSSTSSPPTTSRASPTQFDRLSSQAMFVPAPTSRASHFVPADEALRRLFAVPQYLVERQPIMALCSKATSENRWLLLALRDGSFRSNCLNRDVWNHSAMAALSSSLVCSELDVEDPQGLQALQSFRVDAVDLPVLLLVDPTTSHREMTLQLRQNSNGAFDGAGVVEQVLLFLDEHGLPSHHHRNWTEGQVQELAAPLVVDVDDEDGEDDDTEDLTASPVMGLADSERELPPEVLEVSLDQWKVDEKEPGAFRLRCRLPKDSLTLVLRPDTPVAALLAFLGYRVHALDPETYSTPPPIGIRGGFPPKEVTPTTDESLVLSTWTGVRSGDALIVHII